MYASVNSESEGGSQRVEESVDVVERVLFELGETRSLILYSLILGLANAADAVEVLAFGYVLTALRDPASGKRLDTDPFWSSVLSSGVFLGMLSGGVVAGYLADRFGRKLVLRTSLGLNAIAGLLSAGAALLPTRLQLPGLLAFRFCAGVGVGGSVPSLFTLVSEISPTYARGRYVNVVACFWMIGAIYTAICAWVVLSTERTSTWPAFLCLASLPAATACILTHLVLPESPRFLALQGRIKECKEVLLRLSQGSGYVLDVGSLGLREGTYHARSAGRRYVSYLTLLNSDLRATTFKTSVVWFSLSFGSYGMSTWIGELYTKVGFDDNPYEPALLYAISNLPGNVVAWLVVDRIGAENLVACSMIMASASALLLTAKSRTIILIASSAFSSLSTAGWNALDSFTADRFPLPYRASGFGMVSAAGRLGGVAGNLVNGVLFSTGLYSIAVSLAAAAMVLGSICTISLSKARLVER